MKTQFKEMINDIIMSALVYIYIVYSLYAYIVEICRFQSTVTKNVNYRIQSMLWVIPS